MSEGLSDERLAEIEQRCAAATPGPWVVEVVADHWPRVLYVLGSHYVGVVCNCQRGRPHDAEFVAGAHADVPELLAEVRRLRAVEHELRGHVRALVNRVESLADRAAEGR